MTNQPSPDMGQSVSDDLAALVKSIKAQAADLRNCDTLPRQHRDTQYEIDAAAETLDQAAAMLDRIAAERLRAPVGGDGKSDMEILDAASRDAKGWETNRKGTTENGILYIRKDIALAAMARIRTSAIPDGWRDIETAPKDGTRVLLIDELDRFPWVGSWNQNRGDAGLWQEDGASLPDEQPEYWLPIPAAPTLPIAKVDER